MKNIFFFIAIIFCAFSFTTNVYAADVLFRMTHGDREQDVLILGEIKSIQNDITTIKVIFNFPNSRIQDIEEIDVKEFDKFIFYHPNNLAENIVIGKKYVMSLEQKDNFYLPQWGIYEVTGNNYDDAKLLEIRNGDDAAFQVFINSGGTKKDFFFTDGKAFLRDGENDYQIYPINDSSSSNNINNDTSEEINKGQEKNIFLISIIVVAFIALGIIIWLIKKKK